MRSQNGTVSIFSKAARVEALSAIPRRPHAWNLGRPSHRVTLQSPEQKRTLVQPPLRTQTENPMKLSVHPLFQAVALWLAAFGAFVTVPCVAADGAGVVTGRV